MAFSVRPFAVIHDLKRTIASLRTRWRSSRDENQRLRQEREQWRERADRLQQDADRLQQENEHLIRERDRRRETILRLKQQLDEAKRAGKRQAAPFARGVRAAHPQRPRRKPGAAYGPRARKLMPPRVDEEIPVPAPARCPCGGALIFEKVESQDQEEIVRKTIWKRFDVTICRSPLCHRRVHGRDPRQTADAFGAAEGQLRPDPRARRVTMNNALGLPHADVAS